MKLIITILLILIILIVAGCPQIKPDGFSIGVMYLKTDVPYGEIDEVVPIGLLNFKFD